MGSFLLLPIVGSALQYMSFLGKDMFPITVSLTFPYGFISIVPVRKVFSTCHPRAKILWQRYVSQRISHRIYNHSKFRMFRWGGKSRA